MAEREHIRCLVCGTTRTPDKFGIEGATYQSEAAPTYNPALMIQHIGGRADIRWTESEPSREVMEAMRERVRAALAKLDAMLDDG